eukprot:8685686-Alexandrium_andersonii.AAC.1
MRLALRLLRSALRDVFSAGLPCACVQVLEHLRSRAQLGRISMLGHVRLANLFVHLPPCHVLRAIG